MAHQIMHVRGKREIPLVERSGIRCRRHLGVLPLKGESPGSHDSSLGALRVFDDIVIESGTQLSFQPHDGFEVVLYVLEGSCHVEDHEGQARELARDSAAYALLGQGNRYAISNRASAASTRVLIVATVAPVADPPSRFSISSFHPEAQRMTWIATPESEDPVDGALRIGAPVRLGIVTLDPGDEVTFPHELNRALLAGVLDGNIELGSGFLDEGGDARLSLDSPVRIQGVSRARLLVADVALGFVQQLV